MALTPVPDHLTDAEILQALRARQAGIATFSAEGKGSLSGTTGGDGTFRWQCWAQGTTRMRLTLTHRLKGCLADLVIEGDRAECYDPEVGTLARGPLQSLRVPGLRQTASLLRLLAGPADTLDFGPPPESRLRLTTDAGNRWDLTLNRRYLVYETGELRALPSETPLARVDFTLTDYQAVAGIPWPMEMVVDQPGEPWKLRLRFQKVHMGIPIAPEVFQLKVPEGTKVVEEEAPETPTGS